MNRPNNRTIIRQDFLSFALLVGVTPTPMSQGAQQSSVEVMYETFTICCPSTAPNNVWWGGANVDPVAMNGTEVVAGQTIQYRIVNERQLYEVQGPLVDMPPCAPPILIPFKAWDVATIYLVAAAPTTVGITLFKGSLF